MKHVHEDASLPIISKAMAHLLVRLPPNYDTLTVLIANYGGAFKNAVLIWEKMYYMVGINICKLTKSLL